MDKIEPGQYSYPAEPVFVNYPKEAPVPNSIHNQRWHVWGPEGKVRLHMPCEVYNHSEQTVKVVEPLDFVAERLVLKRNGQRIRYVMATFDEIAQEE